MSTTINPNYEGLFEQCATFRCGENVREGSLVTVTENGTVGPASSTSQFCGIARAVRNGMCSVQLHGYAALSYMGAPPNHGYCSILANDDAQSLIVMEGENARSILVLEVDGENFNCTVLL